MTLTRAGLEIMAVVSNEEVIERWGILIEKAQGKSNEIFQDTSDFIRDYKAPTLRLKRDRLGASTIGSLLGTKRDFLIISDPRLSSYLVFINARDYGENLDVSWYLTYKPKGSILAIFRPVNFLLNNIDLFVLCGMINEIFEKPLFMISNL